MDRRGAKGLAWIVLIGIGFGGGASAQTPAGQQTPSTEKTAPASTAAPTPAKLPVTAGMETPWDVRKILTELLADNQRLTPLLAQLHPQQWYDEKGAPSTYILQWQTAHTQLNDVITTTQMLAQKTEDLSLALDEYFRLEALGLTMRSLQQGAERYADRGTADNLARILASNFTNRERFRDYLRDLASSTEQNFKIADEEAQRCRGMISKEPAVPRKTKR